MDASARGHVVSGGMDGRFPPPLSSAWTPVPNALVDYCEQLGIDGTALRIVIRLESYRRVAGELVWPGQELLAEQLGLSERTIRRATARLEAKGLIHRTQPGGEERRGRGSTRYDLTPLWEQVARLATDGLGGQQASAKPTGIRRTPKACLADTDGLLGGHLLSAEVEDKKEKTPPPPAAAAAQASSSVGGSRTPRPTTTPKRSPTDNTQQQQQGGGGGGENTSGETATADSAAAAAEYEETRARLSRKAAEAQREWLRPRGRQDGLRRLDPTKAIGHLSDDGREDTSA